MSLPARSERPRLKVCHVIHHLAPGGAERLLLDLAATAPTVGLDMSVLSLMGSREQPYARALNELGVPVIDLALPTRWDLRALPRAVDRLRGLGPDLLHSHLKHADIVGAAAATRLGLPLVSTLHQIEDSVTPLGRFKRRAGATARLARADVTVTVSDAQRQWYLQTFAAPPDKVVTVHNGVRAEKVGAGTRQHVRRELGCPDDVVVATMLAVMRPGKGHEDILQAMSELSPDTPLALWLVGDGELRSDLERVVASLGPSGDRVSFLGWRDDVGDLLAASDLVVHPTHFDALPTALIEGLGAGLPSIASDVGGVPEVITPDCGVLLPPRQPSKWAGALAELALDAERRRRLGTAARQRFEQHFSADAWARRLRDLYDDVVFSS